MGSENGVRKWGQKMGSENGVRKWGQKMGSENGVRKWGQKMGKWGAKIDKMSVTIAHPKPP
jgi:hypothetical protein